MKKIKSFLQKTGFLFLCAGGAGLLVLSGCSSDGALKRRMTADGTVYRWAVRWFGEGVRPLIMPGSPVFEVVYGDLTLGFIYNTADFPPVVEGKRGEISVLVGVDTDKNVMGIRPVKWKEDPDYFSKLDNDFYDAFAGYNELDNPSLPEAVTGATLSSQAIITDVSESINTVFDRKEVKEVLARAAEQLQREIEAEEAAEREAEAKAEQEAAEAAEAEAAAEADAAADDPDVPASDTETDAGTETPETESAQ